MLYLEITVSLYYDVIDEGEHAEGKKSSDYELLCGNGGRAALSEYKNCKLGHVPPRVVSILFHTI